jgi:adenylate kinase
MHPLRGVILGPPASGKGTQGRILAETLDLNYLGTGALLRAQIEQGSELGKLAQPFLARGSYLPDNLMSPLIEDWLSRQTGGWLVDGFPRSLPQALFLADCMARQDHPLDFAISLEVPFSELITRMEGRLECGVCRWTGQYRHRTVDSNCPQCGGAIGRRADDDEENFQSRHKAFIEITQPVIQYYRQRGRLISCDATAPQVEVTTRLLTLLPGVLV